MNRAPLSGSLPIDGSSANDQNWETSVDAAPVGKTSENSQINHDSWQDFMKSAVRSRAVLEKELELIAKIPGEIANLVGPALSTDPSSPRSSTPSIEKPERDFPVFVTRPFLARIEKGNWNDPLLKQVLPLADEQNIVPGYSQDPLAEANATISPGLLHKYQGRALVVATSVCAINCRYCFRRHFPYQQISQSLQHRNALMRQIASDPTISEVILSGGDPLLMVDSLLTEWFQGLESIAHVRRIRIHTRLPIMIPRRVTPRLLDLIKKTRLATVFVIHSNHAAELDCEVAAALDEVGRSGAVLLNQSVLLAGINDNVNALTDLSERLIECGVLPYYLHKNDPIAGTAHFEVSIERGIKLIDQMRGVLPGYAVPRFAQEVAGETNKRVLA